MEFEGTVKQVLPVFKTQTQRGEFVKQEVVFEYQEQGSDFTRMACVAFTGDRAQNAANLKPGERVRVRFNLESREWNGRWFTEARGWRIDQPAPQYGAPQYGAPQYGAPQYAAPQPAPQQPAAYPVYAAPAQEPAAPEAASQAVADDIPF